MPISEERWAELQKIHDASITVVGNDNRVNSREAPIQTFVLRRLVDASGVSGVGDVAEGVVFTDGTVAMRWRGDKSSIVIHDSIDNVMAVHGHDGKTRLVWSHWN